MLFSYLYKVSALGRAKQTQNYMADIRVHLDHPFDSESNDANTCISIFITTLKEMGTAPRISEK